MNGLLNYRYCLSGGIFDAEALDITVIAREAGAPQPV